MTANLPLTGAVEVNILAQGALHWFTQWPESNTQYSNWETDTRPLSCRRSYLKQNHQAIIPSS